MTINGTPGNEFDSGAVAVTSSSTYVEICTIQAAGRPLSIHGDAGAGGALAHLKLTSSPVLGGTHKDLAEDTDFATATTSIPRCQPSNPHAKAGGGTFQMKLDAGQGEYTIYAKKVSGDTTLRIRGRVL